ncbi:unnamed protein product, partial [Hapterophycus canaliculatus]
QELRQVFDRVDTDKSGDLTLDELKAAFSRADPLLHESAVEEIMTMLDLDAVGSVSFEEVSGEERRPSCPSRRRGLWLGQWVSVCDWGWVDGYGW